MSDDDQPIPPNPFQGMPFFNDMMRAMASQGALNWDLATQFAAAGAKGDSDDPQPDPAVRLEWNRLADIADLHVRNLTNLSTGPGESHLEVHTVTRALWAHRTLTDLRPLFTDLATALSSAPETAREQPNDPLMAMMSNLTSMMAPAMMGMSIGSMIGSLARHAFGQYDLPLPRENARELLIISSSVDAFANDWSIARDDLRMWVLIHELASHAVLTSSAVLDGLMPTLRDHVSGFRPDPSAVLDRLEHIDPSDPEALGSIQNLFADPMVLLGAVRSPEQEALAPLLDARVAAIQGYIDWIVDAVGSSLLGTASPIAEAVRRRRLEYGTDAQLIERLLGLTMTRTQLARGRAFIDGVIERDGAGALAQLVTDPMNLPTPNEVDAPGLWLARLDVQ